MVSQLSGGLRSRVCNCALIDLMRVRLSILEYGQSQKPEPPSRTVVRGPGRASAADCSTSGGGPITFSFYPTADGYRASCTCAARTDRLVQCFEPQDDRAPGEGRVCPVDFPAGARCAGSRV